MKLGILKETQIGEKRVSLSPFITKKLIEKGFEILDEPTCSQIFLSIFNYLLFLFYSV